MAHTTPYQSFALLTPAEQETLLTAGIEKAEARNLGNGWYIIYTNELCISSDLFIHEYKNGKRQLVSVNVSTGDVSIVREL